MVWNYDNTSLVHVELSNLCNAACPLCPRYVHGSLRVNPELDTGSISLEDFKKWFPLDFVKRSKAWIFCGTNGDPIMARDAYEILEYVARNSTAKIQINTNGSIRDEEFWEKMGHLFAEPCLNSRYVVFSVDGLEDTNHIYRRNVKWDRVMENMKAYRKSRAVGIWDFLIFKHNEHQLKEAENLSNEIGLAFSPKRPFGFESNKSGFYQDLMVYDAEGNFLYNIEPGSQQFRLNKSMEKFQIGKEKIFVPGKGKPTKEETDARWNEAIEKNLPDYKFPEGFKDKSVSCKSCHPEGKEIYVDCKGNVMPCCFVGTMYNGNFQHHEALQIKKRMNDYGLSNINLNNNSLEDILNSNYLNSVFADRWESAENDEEKMGYCFNTCSVDHMKNLFIKKPGFPIKSIL
jgi:MoaA/NifB/PqqE/SkfB family radical SAM enzyme